MLPCQGWLSHVFTYYSWNVCNFSLMGELGGINVFVYIFVWFISLIYSDLSQMSVQLHCWKTFSWDSRSPSTLSVMQPQNLFRWISVLSITTVPFLDGVKDTFKWEKLHVCKVNAFKTFTFKIKCWLNCCMLCFNYLPYIKE